MKPYCVTIQTKAYNQYLRVVLFVLASKSEREDKLLNIFINSCVTFKASYQVSITGGCAETTLGDRSQNENPEIPSMSWIQTPSIVDMGTSKIICIIAYVHT